MKTLLLSILFLFSFQIVKSQDIIISKDGNIYNVKIIKQDKDYLYMYMNGDSTKSVRRIGYSVISSYDYKSKNDMKYKSEDSLLYANYLKEKEFNMLESGSTSPTNMYELKISNPTEYYFTKAQNQFVTSTVCSVLGIVVVSIIASNVDVPSDVTNPNYITDLEDYVQTLKTLRNIQYGLLGASAVFTIAAGNNFFNGFVELSKMKVK